MPRSGRLICRRRRLSEALRGSQGIRRGAAWLELHDRAAVFVHDGYLLLPAARKRIAKASLNATAAMSAKEHKHPNFASHRGSPKDSWKVVLWRRASPAGAASESSLIPSEARVVGRDAFSLILPDILKTKINIA